MNQMLFLQPTAMNDSPTNTQVFCTSDQKLAGFVENDNHPGKCCRASFRSVINTLPHSVRQE